MKNYYDEFVELAEQYACRTEHITDKSRRDKSNAAMKKLSKLREQMKNEPDQCLDIFRKLLIHPNDLVKLCAATHCAEEDVLEEDYKNALKLVFEAAAVTKNRAIILDAYFVTARVYGRHLRRQIAAQQQAQQDEAK